MFRSLLCLALAALTAAASLCAATKEKDKDREQIAAAPELSEQDVKAIGELFQRLSAGFLAGDASACMRVFVPGLGTREQIEDNLINEFKQSRYLKFEIVQILPAEKLQPSIHSVDVRLRFEFINLNRPPEMQQPIRNSTTETFAVKKLDDGSFALLHSEFFDSLGMRQGMGLVVEGLLALMFAIALLGFWTWMGWETLRTRPREVAWQLIVLLLPVIGAVVYFGVRYIPRQLRGART
ncbi:MAG TPA: hypothetical protein VEK08_16730 [Planctomycetota bacterium]|nr:hypothetical protein [Planctomycetota bacterium]